MGPDFHQDPSMPHDHQCGMTSSGPWNFGCGHQWTHTLKLAHSMKEYVDAHRCPECGQGPWYFVIEDSSMGGYSNKCPFCGKWFFEQSAWAQHFKACKERR